MASITRMFISAALLLATVALIYGSPIGNPRIYGGDKAKPGQFPYVVSLRVQTGNKTLHLCGGSILSDKIVVTSAHCYSSEYPLLTSYRVYVGANTREDGQAYKLRRFVNHPESNLGTFANDIALIELTAPIQFNENVAKIELEKNFVQGNERSTVAGYGWTTTDSIYYHNNDLRYLEVSTMSNEACKRTFGRPGDVLIKDNLLCTSANWKQGYCYDDNGNPLVHDNKLIGIASYSYTRSGCGALYPDVYTRISAHLDWIDEVTNTKA